MIPIKTLSGIWKALQLLFIYNFKQPGVRNSLAAKSTTPQGFPKSHHTLIICFIFGMIYFLLIFQDIVLSPMNNKKVNDSAEDTAKKDIF